MPSLRLSPRIRFIALRALELTAVFAIVVLGRMYAVTHWKLTSGDVIEYNTYAQAFWLTHPPLHQLPVEYPPLAILPFSLTLLPPLADIQTIFSLWMAAIVTVGYAGFLRFSTRRRGLIYLLYLLLGSDAVLTARFDIVPALVTLAALWATERKRFTLAYLLLAVGILLKLYPAFLLPVVMIAHWQAVRANHPAGWRWRAGARALATFILRDPAVRAVAAGTGLCLGVVVLAFACAMALAGSDALSGFTYASDRPLQIESTPATILWLGTLVGIPAHPEFSFISLNMVGPLDVALKPLSAVALVAGCLFVYWRQMRGRLTIGQAMLACLCAVIVTNKIFSPQYIIWVLPFVAAVEGFSLLWVVIGVLTTLDFPIVYGLRAPIWDAPFSWQFMPVIAARNLLMLYATLRAMLRSRRQRVSGASTTDQAPGESASELATETAPPLADA
ncbi:MAG TPA: glycosyltransferase family 87 protein, partial [Ktedonobacterales bacterium]|nr:glycosyltransferase family 87 protein [Ktedonobacterales bacterium]